MKMYCRHLLLGLLFGILVPSLTHAQPLPIDPIGARSVALGGASAVLTTGADAVYQNPASLVWQQLTFGGGIQPSRITKWPRSWWFYFYNRNTSYDMPIALITQGWTVPTPLHGDRHVGMVGLPVAFNFTPATPGAATIKLAWERDEDGKTHWAVPIDAGFLGRTNSGAIIGLVFRNLTFNKSPLKELKKRVDVGIGWGGGPATVLLSSTVNRLDKSVSSKDFHDHYRVGAELASEQGVALRGGYIKDGSDWYATGGIGLRSKGVWRSEFSYSLLYNPQTKHFRHFIEYIFLLG